MSHTKIERNFCYRGLRAAIRHGDAKNARYWAECLCRIARFEVQAGIVQHGPELLYS